MEPNDRIADKTTEAYYQNASTNLNSIMALYYLYNSFVDVTRALLVILKPGAKRFDLLCVIKCLVLRLRVLVEKFAYNAQV